MGDAGRWTAGSVEASVIGDVGSWAISSVALTARSTGAGFDSGTGEATWRVASGNAQGEAGNRGGEALP